MDVWAHIASFMPFDELLGAFWALRRAGLLPYTHSTPSNAFLQFASEHAEVVERETQTYTIDTYLHKTFCEIFDPALVDYSVHLNRGNHDAVLEHLLHLIA